MPNPKTHLAVSIVLHYGFQIPDVDIIYVQYIQLIYSENSDIWHLKEFY